MSNQQEIQQKSRLGTLLLHKGMINRRQLDEALQLQSSSKLMLGEIMVRQGWISERELNKILRRQSRYRLVAAASALLLGPIQPFVASAHAATESAHTAEQYMEKRGLQALSDDDMAGITGQGLADNVEYLQDVLTGDASDEDAPASSVMATLETVLPGLNMLTDYEISDVEYYDDGPATTLNEDGSLSVKVPKRIGEIAFRDVNFRGSTGPAMGDLVIKNLSMTQDSSITIRLRD